MNSPAHDVVFIGQSFPESELWTSASQMGMTVQELKSEGSQFLALRDYLLQNWKTLEYVLLTDTNVSFASNPHTFMRSLDTALDHHFLYGASEWRHSIITKPAMNVTPANSLTDTWRHCFA